MPYNEIIKLKPEGKSGRFKLKSKFIKYFEFEDRPVIIEIKNDKIIVTKIKLEIPNNSKLEIPENSLLRVLKMPLSLPIKLIKGFNEQFLEVEYDMNRIEIRKR